jgi:uncharacterized delta-60 repeat protein
VTVLLRLRRSGGAALLAWCLSAAAHAAGWTAALPNGQLLNIVEGATATASGYFLERRFGAGIRDPQFGSGGRTFFTLGSDNSPPITLQVDAAGRILVVGSTETGNGRSAAVVLRFLPNGQVDAAWGQQGRSLIGTPRGNANAADALALTDGPVLVLGSIDDDQNENAALWRLNPSGQLDATFGNAGLMLASALPQSQGISLQQAADGLLRIAVQAGRADKVWLEVHDWKAGAPRPVRAARQELPEEWVGPPVLTQRGETWIWVDSSQPMTPPLQLVAAAGESVWTPASNVTTAARGEATPAAAGHAAVNPFNEPGALGTSAASITIDDVAWPGMLLAILALIGGAFWWWWRRG